VSAFCLRPHLGCSVPPVRFSPLPARDAEAPSCTLTAGASSPRATGLLLSAGWIMDGSALWGGVLSSGCDRISPMKDAWMWGGRCQSSYKPACIRSRPGGSQVPEEVRREPACHSGGEMVPSHHLMFERRTSRLYQLTPAPPISGHIDRFAIYTCMCLFMPVQHPVIWEVHAEVP
jgi:hypothetical protein